MTSQSETAARSTGEDTDTVIIANIWRRLGGGLIDLLVLVFISAVLGRVVHAVGLPIGQWGRLFGWVLGIAYLGLFNSRLLGGRTLGKLLMGTVTVDAELERLDVGPALLRGAVLSTIFIVNGLSLSVASPILQTVTTVVFGGILLCGGFLLLYNYLFNKQTRRGPHDWLAGSYVVRYPIESDAASVPEPNPFHRQVGLGCFSMYLVLVIAGIGISISGISVLGIESTETIGDLRSQILASEPSYRSVNIVVNTTSQVGNPDFDALVTLNITVDYPYKCDGSEECFDQIKEIGEIALEEYDNLERLSGMRVTLVRETHLGWFRWHNSTSTAYSIADWRDYVND